MYQMPDWQIDRKTMIYMFYLNAVIIIIIIYKALIMVSLWESLTKNYNELEKVHEKQKSV